MGLRIWELERIYGIKHGSSNFQGNQHKEVIPNNSETPKTQDYIAKQMGISVDTLANYKLLSKMIPELSDLVDTGIVTNIYNTHSHLFPVQHTHTILTTTYHSAIINQRGIITPFRIQH